MVLAPGYGGDDRQPILRALAARLAKDDIAARAVTFSTRGSRPSHAYERELADLRGARERLREEGAERIALVGRSFGGRMCAFLARAEPPDALAILGHPIAPPGRPRTDDEAALEAVACPTLVVQGERDPFGMPPEGPERTVVRVPGSHALRSTAEVSAAVSAWLAALVV